MHKSHIELAHAYWKQLLKPGDAVIDATCGNGHDALFLCSLLLNREKPSQIYLIDRQAEAIQNTKERLYQHFGQRLSGVKFFQQCHSQFPEEISSIKLIVYNLGYLPGGNKEITTISLTTIESLKAATKLVAAGGTISVTCYPGHAAGKIEEQAVLEYASALPATEWSCCHHRWTNRHEAPSLLMIYKKTK